jgi:hypothetical protein
MFSTQPLGVAPVDNRLGGNSLWFEVIVFWELKINSKIKITIEKYLTIFEFTCLNDKRKNKQDA